MAQFVQITMKPRGASRSITRRLELIRDETLGNTRVVSGRRVNSQGDPVNFRMDQDNIDVFVGVQRVVNLVIDFKYGNLVPEGTASQDTDPQYMS